VRTRAAANVAEPDWEFRGNGGKEFVGVWPAACQRGIEENSRTAISNAGSESGVEMQTGDAGAAKRHAPI
jgi:hypothetical protein